MLNGMQKSPWDEHWMNCVQLREMEQVVLEDREEQEKLRQQQAEARTATKVTTSNHVSDQMNWSDS